MISKEEFKKKVEIVSSKSGKNQEQLAIDMGYGKNYISEMFTPSGKISAKFVFAFELKWAEYLENPNSETFEKSEEGPNYIKERKKLKNVEKAKQIPFYDAEAAAGMVETEMTPIHAPAGTIDIGDLLRDSQAAIRIYGNSMMPNYPPGCVVGLLKVTKNFIEPGEVYVVETRDRRLLKRLYYKNDETNSDMITCYSDNILPFTGGARHGKLAYPPFDIPKEEIVNMFAVTGVIKRNSNSVIINR